MVSADTFDPTLSAIWPDPPRDLPLVSVVIPCFNHARYLGESIESALAQTHRSVEVMVVDDGSTDDTAVVARRYHGVRFVRQANAGLPAARNAGLRMSGGDFLVFLDADDRLLPDALATGVRSLLARPDWAFVSGHYRDIDAAGRALAEWPHRCVQRDHYREFLRAPYIAMHATVMFRREPLEQVGAYDPALPACEDYDLYLRLARAYPVGCHCAMAAEYRQHGANMTGDPERMLRAVMTVMRRQWPHCQTSSDARSAYRDGVRFWQRYYGRKVADDVCAALVGGRWRRAALDLRTLLRDHRRGLLRCAATLARGAGGVLARPVSGRLPRRPAERQA